MCWKRLNFLIEILKIPRLTYFCASGKIVKIEELFFFSSDSGMARGFGHAENENVSEQIWHSIRYEMGNFVSIFFF